MCLNKTFELTKCPKDTKMLFDVTRNIIQK